MRWDFPPPPGARARPVANVGDLSSSSWRAWMKPEHRCLAPATSCVAYTDASLKIAHWFALGRERRLFIFAGLRPWRGVRGKQGGEHRLYAILAKTPNDLVAPIHAKAMPVMLSDATTA